jgi:hypothetical protein
MKVLAFRLALNSILFSACVAAAAKTLRILLSFAVGGLLGDVFFHLLPEAWASEQNAYLAKNPGELENSPQPSRLSPVARALSPISQSADPFFPASEL